MISRVTIYVEHGETTDPLDSVLSTMGLDSNYPLDVEGATILDYKIKIGLDSCPVHNRGRFDSTCTCKDK